MTWLRAAVGLTVFDAVATGAWLSTGLAREGNPWLDWLVNTVGTWPAMAVRTGVGVVLLLALDALGEHSALARRALPVLALVLLALAAYHVAGASLTLLER